VVSTSTPTRFDGSVPARYRPGTPAYEKVSDAARTYRRSGHARILSFDDGTEVYPYGQEVPTIYTPVLHFSTVELAQNEYVVDMSIGDKSRWSVTTGSMGQKGEFRQMVYIKPQECGPMETNLLLATNQGRTYEMVLKSIPCNMARGQRPDTDQWDRRISFYYPDGRNAIGPANMTKQMQPPAQARRRSSPGRAPRMAPSPRADSNQMRPSRSRPPMRRVSGSSSPPARPASAAGSAPNPGQSGRTSRFRSDRFNAAKIDMRDVETNHYEIDVDRRFPCEPDFVGDDGERTYIRLGDSPGCMSTFPYYVIKEDRGLQIANYSVFNGQTYVIEGVHPKAALLFRDESGREHRATITNTKLDNPRPRR
jgi:hypothetical protein